MFTIPCHTSRLFGFSMRQLATKWVLSNLHCVCNLYIDTVVMVFEWAIVNHKAPPTILFVGDGETEKPLLLY